MSSIDLGPFYRSSIGYDRIGALIDNALRSSDSTAGYPPYNIEVLDENHYAISVAVAGFKRENLDITVEKGVLTIAGDRREEIDDRRFLHNGIAGRAFKRHFNLAEHVEVTDADLKDGLLTVNLKREIPEAMKPRTIPISDDGHSMLEHDNKHSHELGSSNRAA